MMVKKLIFLVVVKDDQSKKVNGMGSKSSTMDSINSYGGSRNAMDDGQEASDDVEKARLISQVLELQNTLDDLNQRSTGVKEENLRLKSENLVLGQYIGNIAICLIDYPFLNSISSRKSYVSFICLLFNKPKQQEEINRFWIMQILQASCVDIIHIIYINSTHPM